MKTQLALSFALIGATAFGNPADPQISNFSVRQDPSRVVRVAYTLDEPAYVTMEILTNGVSIGSENIKFVTGDVNKLVQVGSHTIEWNARKSWPDHRIDTPSFSVEITAWAEDNPPDVMDIDLENKTVSYYQSVDALPGGGLANDKYRTTHLVMKKVRAAGMTFQMGSPADESLHNSGRGSAETLHAVAFTNDYYLAIYETTRRQFALMGCTEPNWSGATQTTPFGSDDYNQCPIGFITYNNLRGTAPTINWPTTGTTVGGYLATIRSTIGLDLDFDLPTEAQWEFACRAGTTTQNYSGRDYSGEFSSPVGEEIAWYHYNSVKEDLGNGNYTYYVHAVGGKPANPWGFFDMYGNIQEWCLDWIGAYDTSVSPAINPEGPATGGSRSSRGSNYSAMSAHIRSAYRGAVDPSQGLGQHGFRLCLTLPQASGEPLATATASASVGLSNPFAFVSRDHVAEESTKTTFSTFEPATMIYLR